MNDYKYAKSRAARSIVRDLVVTRGMGYVDAVRHCEQEAKRAAQPWNDAAAEIRHWLKENEARRV